MLKAAGRWTRRGVQVTLVNDAPYLFYSGMTPEYVGGRYRLDEVRIDLAGWCRKNGVRFVCSPVSSLNVARRVLRTESGFALPCDLAVFNVGAINPLQRKAGDAVLSKPLRHIEELGGWLEGVLSRPQPRRTLVVVGGGPAGTEVMLNLSARLRRSARPDALRLILIHPEDRLTPQFGPGLGRRAERMLRARGVALRLGEKVARVEEAFVEVGVEDNIGVEDKIQGNVQGSNIQGNVEGSAGYCAGHSSQPSATHCVVLESGARLPADLVLWATGTTGQPLFREAGLPVTEEGYVRVGRDLRSVAVPWLFAAGDCAAVEGLDLDRSGVNAVREGLVLRDNLDRLVRAAGRERWLERVRLEPFRPHPVSPYLLSTGAPEAMLALGPTLWLRGRALLWLKHRLDRRWTGLYHLDLSLLTFKSQPSGFSGRWTREARRRRK